MIFLLGCSNDFIELSSVKDFLRKDPDAADAVSAVRAYNKALVSAYRQNDPAPLRDFATDREFNKVSHLIEDILSQSLIMEAELERMRIEKVERWGPDNVVVTTKENWRYRRINVKTKEEAKPLTSIEYHMRYNMVREKGLWKVFDLSPV